MTLAIMQPYFFPYLGYFALIKHSDQFILFDTPQFIRHGWIERNQVLKPDGETLYVKVPLRKHPRSTAIKDILINNSEDWRSKIIAQLAPYKKKAPYFKQVTNLLDGIFKIKTESIVVLNFESLKVISNYLNLKTPITIWSEMGVEIDEVNSPDEWALNICKALKADSYINPIGGMSFFDTEKYLNSRINISFLNHKPTEYPQISTNFVPFLSIIDVMMFNSPEKINEYLDNYELL
ncbi:MAG: WbqC family protein [Flavobacteriales bacterium]|nr:WbqC family protein [Flavobacteriales bacterium]MCB9173559.1 WbqC family protein [Flavobacteriales bacterium]MCB9365427.1 WbqC family protein [Flavobacteriales bacterium]